MTVNMKIHQPAGIILTDPKSLSPKTFFSVSHSASFLQFRKVKTVMTLQTRLLLSLISGDDITDDTALIFSPIIKTSLRIQRHHNCRRQNYNWPNRLIVSGLHSPSFVSMLLTSANWASVFLQPCKSIIWSLEILKSFHCNLWVVLISHEQIWTIYQYINVY